MDQDTTSLIWTIIAIVAIFYLLNYLMTCKETSSEKFQTGGTVRKSHVRDNMIGGAEPGEMIQTMNKLKMLILLTMMCPRMLFLVILIFKQTPM